MGMKIGTGNRNVKTITIKNPDGTVAGNITVIKSARKKIKCLKYNFKEISAQIMKAKTSGNARKAASNARIKVAMLRQKLRNEEYDSKELESKAPMP